MTPAFAGTSGTGRPPMPFDRLARSRALFDGSGWKAMAVWLSGFSGPVQLHMEYDELGGAASGRRELTAPKEKVLAMMRRDVDTLKVLLREAGLS